MVADSIYKVRIEKKIFFKCHFRTPLIWAIAMATRKGLSSSLMVQIVTHWSMKKVTKFEERIFSRFWVMLENRSGGGCHSPLPSRNRVKS